MNTDWHTKNNFDNKPIQSSVRKLSLELQKTNSIWIEVEAFFVSTETVHLQQQCCLMQMKIESSLEPPLNTKKQTIVMLRRWKTSDKHDKVQFFPSLLTDD